MKKYYTPCGTQFIEDRFGGEGRAMQRARRAAVLGLKGVKGVRE
jgi:hypothetical protein